MAEKTELEEKLLGLVLSGDYVHSEQASLRESILRERISPGLISEVKTELEQTNMERMAARLRWSHLEEKWGRSAVNLARELIREETK